MNISSSTYGPDILRLIRRMPEIASYKNAIEREMSKRTDIFTDIFLRMYDALKIGGIMDPRFDKLVDRVYAMLPTDRELAESIRQNKPIEYPTTDDIARALYELSNSFDFNS